MNIEGRVIIEKYRGCRLLERREFKNVIRQRLVEYITYYIWYRLAIETGFCNYVGCDINRGIRHPLRLSIADTGKLTIKYIDASGLSRTTNTATGQHIVRITWTDGSPDTYTIGYLGIFTMADTLTAGQDNITGSPGAFVATKVDPSISKASEDTMTIMWDIIFPYGEVS